MSLFPSEIPSSQSRDSDIVKNEEDMSDPDPYSDTDSNSDSDSDIGIEVLIHQTYLCS